LPDENPIFLLAHRCGIAILSGVQLLRRIKKSMDFQNSTVSLVGIQGDDGIKEVI
jgi:hypothetical protein